MKEGGAIILLGSCAEGFGESHFTDWMTKYRNPHDMVEEIQRNFILGAHKAAAIAMVREKAEIYLVSDMDEETVRQTILTPAKDLETAYALACEGRENPTVIAMPYGGSTLPEYIGK